MRVFTSYGRHWKLYSCLDLAFFQHKQYMDDNEYAWEAGRYVCVEGGAQRGQVPAASLSIFP